jgi:thiamine-monophosphate kinase
MNNAGRKLDSELNLIQRIAARAAKGSKGGMVAGIGDDCAIYRPRRDEDLLFTTDFLIEDVHFRRNTHSAADVGHKALARGLSDVAAMGGEPRFCLLSLALAPWTDNRWVDGFYKGLLGLAANHGVELAGGDLSHAKKLACDIVVCGATPQGKALRRDGAHPDDLVYVSGRLGKPWQTHLRPKPRLDFGVQLRGRATAAMDLSDGLSIDLHRLCEASGVAAELDRVPIVRGSSLQQALHGGEDYELLFTMPPRRTPPKGSIRIGRIIEGQAGAVTLNGQPVPALGYDHFR